MRDRGDDGQWDRKTVRPWSALLKIVALASGVFVFWLLAVWPPPVWYRTHWPAETAFMEMRRAARRKPVRQYHPIPLDSMSRSVQDAAIIGEDNSFRTHSGVDYGSLRNALGYRHSTFEWTSTRDRGELLPLLPRVWTRRDALRGASTITQQLAKNLYLSPSRNPLRKLKEAATAYRLEATLEKDRILELYLNVVELGDEVWGVEAASRKYYGRPAGQLSQEQTAELAGALPFPLRSNPGYRPGRMRWRQALILRRMRGEAVEVPREEEEVEEVPAPEGQDTLQAAASDSLVDTLTAPRPDSLGSTDTVGPLPVPRDSAAPEP
ncbi:MAG: transglycosylase domain-containing protein [Gemmatimonadales bacterium]